MSGCETYTMVMLACMDMLCRPPLSTGSPRVLAGPNRVDATCLPACKICRKHRQTDRQTGVSQRPEAPCLASTRGGALGESPGSMYVGTGSSCGQPACTAVTHQDYGAAAAASP